MYWIYRLVEEVDPQRPEEHAFLLKEVYYNDDDSMLGYCTPSLISDTPEGMYAGLELMLADARKYPPILADDSLDNDEQP